MNPDFTLTKGWADPALFSVLLSEVQSDLKCQLTWSKGWPARATQDHKMARYGDEGISYSYKDKQKPVHVWTETLELLRNEIEAEIQWRSNCCVVNTYGPGGDLHPHRDSTFIPQLGNLPTIAAVSFGAARHFLFFETDKKGKREKEPAHRILLEPGDLLVMHGSCDEKYLHAIQPEEVEGLRLSLTYRKHF